LAERPQFQIPQIRDVGALAAFAALAAACMWPARDCELGHASRADDAIVGVLTLELAEG